MFALFLGSSSGPSPGKMHRETQTLREATRLQVHVAARDDGVVTTADCRVAGYLVPLSFEPSSIGERLADRPRRSEDKYIDACCSQNSRAIHIRFSFLTSVQPTRHPWHRYISSFEKQ